MSNKGKLGGVVRADDITINGQAIQAIKQSGVKNAQNEPYDGRNNPHGITTVADFANASPEQQRDVLEYASKVTLPPGLADNRTQKLMYILQSNAPGTVLNANDFDALKKASKAEVFTRYVGSTSQSGEEHTKSELYGQPQDMYVGGSASVHGRGTYFAQNPNDAKPYGTVPYSMMLTSDAKVLEWNDRHHYNNKDTSSVTADYKKWAAQMGIRADNKHKGLYAIAKGYDAIRALGGNAGGKNHDFIVLLNRRHTISKKGL